MLSISVDDVAGIIRAQVGDKLPADAALGPDAVLEDLGLSSLDITEVFVSIEELVGRELDSVPAADAKTLAELVAVVDRQLTDAEPSTAR
ncbi:MAG TPA: phosphopantetheine-binding protein [Conexibacter sp.]|nr:phosphopantetheine-binding protein [Conexibacter sp.]